MAERVSPGSSSDIIEIKRVFIWSVFPVPIPVPLKLSGRRPATAEKSISGQGSGKAAEAAIGKRAAILEAAKNGVLPPIPDFSAPTHGRFRKKLDRVVAMVKAKDIDRLKAFEINPVSTSPKAIARYCELAVIALQAKAAATASRPAE